jgi:hypothetical protein
MLKDKIERKKKVESIELIHQTSGLSHEIKITT